MWYLWRKGNEQPTSFVEKNPNIKINNIDFNDIHIVIANTSDAFNIEGKVIEKYKGGDTTTSMMWYRIRI